MCAVSVVPIVLTLLMPSESESVRVNARHLPRPQLLRDWETLCARRIRPLDVPGDLAENLPVVHLGGLATA